MMNIARATTVAPEAAPDRTRRGDGTGGSGSSPGSGRGRGRPETPKSALDGLRRLAGQRSSGGSGGRGRPTRRPDAGGPGRLDLRNTWQILVGSILIPLGVVFILMAWYGAAHTPYVQQQIPYLVSGSFAGLGCLVLGGLLYWAHWLYRIYDQADLHHEEQLRAFEQALRAIVDRAGVSDTNPGGTPAVAAAGGRVDAGIGSGPGSGGPASSGVATASGSYVVTASGSVYHLPTCPVIAHHAEGLRVLGAAGVSGMDPCRICLPTGS